MEKGERTLQAKGEKSRCSHAGLRTSRGCPMGAGSHLGQARHGYSGPRGTEGAAGVQADETAVTEALRVVGAPLPVCLWGQPLSHQLFSRVCVCVCVCVCRGGVLTLPKPHRSRKRSPREVRPHVPTPLQSEEQGRGRGKKQTSPSASSFLGDPLTSVAPKGSPVLMDQLPIALYWGMGKGQRMGWRERGGRKRRKELRA